MFSGPFDELLEAVRAESARTVHLVSHLVDEAEKQPEHQHNRNRDNDPEDQTGERPHARVIGAAGSIL
jgi:hypothetical protein